MMDINKIVDVYKYDHYRDEMSDKLDYSGKLLQFIAVYDNIKGVIEKYDGKIVSAPISRIKVRECVNNSKVMRVID